VNDQSKRRDACAAWMRRTALASAACIVACTDPGAPHEIDYGTSTGGLFDEGGAATTAGSADDGADTTGGGPHETQSCLVDDDPEGLELGYRFQCDGQFTIRAELTYTGGSFDEPVPFTFGHEMGDDPYEDPLVMACCRSIDPAEESCGLPHWKGCAIDLVEQGCLSMGPGIETEANKHSGVVKDKMNQVAKWINSEEGQEACRQAFFIDTGLRDAEVGCSEPDPYTFIEGAQWVADHGVSDVSPVTLTVSSVEIFDFFPDPWFEPDDDPVQCSSDDFNNMIFFAQTGDGPGDTKVELDAGSMILSGSVDGQHVGGDGDLLGTLNGCTGDECSHMAFAMQSTGIASLNELVAISSAPADVGTSTETIALDRFRVELWETAIGSHTSFTRVVIPAGKAQFIVSTSSDNACYGVIGVNETQIQLQKVRDTYWSSSSFTILHYDGDNEPWELVVMPSRWR
jgi:hypothetical protein